jgi:peptide subunit release factor 1 (eRF1)
MTSKEHVKKEAAENTKRGLGTIIGKISGKGQFELEIDRLNSRIVKLESDLQSTKTQLEKKEALARQAVTDRQEAEARLNRSLSESRPSPTSLRKSGPSLRKSLSFAGLKT